jgi:hypothetical protein
MIVRAAGTPDASAHSPDSVAALDLAIIGHLLWVVLLMVNYYRGVTPTHSPPLRAVDSLCCRPPQA